MLSSPHTAVFYPMSNNSKSDTEEVLKKKCFLERMDWISMFSVSAKSWSFKLISLWERDAIFVGNSPSVLSYGIINSDMCRWPWLLGQGIHLQSLVMSGAASLYLLIPWLGSCCAAWWSMVPGALMQRVQ